MKLEQAPNHFTVENGFNGACRMFVYESRSAPETNLRNDALGQPLELEQALLITSFVVNRGSDMVPLLRQLTRTLVNFVADFEQPEFIEEPCVLDRVLPDTRHQRRP